MKKFLSKKVVLIASIAVVALAIIGGYFLLTDNKKDKENDPEISVNVIESINVLSSANEALSAELVKKNIVKIVNHIGDEQIVGTGFFIEQGYLVTNSHVADIKGNISIEYYDGTKDTAILFSNDITSDVALLIVENPKALAMKFGSTINLNITDTLLAIGYAYNLSGGASVTKGILSARRSAAGVEYLQTDAAINAGFSGGPLINSKAELMGMNSLATENASIGMAISSESLENVIYKLISNQIIAYIEDERPKNALSTVLIEVGYKTDDIYNESKFYKNKKDNNQKENANNTNEKSNIKLSNIATLDSLVIDGHNINFSKNNDYYTIIISDKAPLNIKAKTTDSKATYAILDNGPFKVGFNGVNVRVTAENKKNYKDYWIKVLFPTTKLNREIKTIELLGGLEYNSSIGSNCIGLYWWYKDNDGVGIIDEVGVSDLWSKVAVDLYYGSGILKDGQIVNNDDYIPWKLLKKYTFNPKSTSEASVFIPLKEIKDLLTEDDYIDGQAYLTFAFNITTREYGTFITYTNYILPK